MRVLLFTMHDDEETMSNGLAAGARGYVLKSDSDAVRSTAKAVLAALTPAMSGQIITADSRIA